MQKYELPVTAAGCAEKEERERERLQRPLLHCASRDKNESKQGLFN